MNRPSLVPEPDICLLDLRDSLLIRMKAINLIRESIVDAMECRRWGDLPATVFLLDLIIRDSKDEINLAFEAGREVFKQ